MAKRRKTTHSSLDLYQLHQKDYMVQISLSTAARMFSYMFGREYQPHDARWYPLT
jgi:hypothetical protein